MSNRRKLRRRATVIPSCVEIAPNYGERPVPPELARDGVHRVIAWTCLDPDCPVPRDDDGPRDRLGVHYLLFTR